MFISVDLPAPFSPSSACTSPGRSSKSTRSLARTPGNRFVIPLSSSAAGASIGRDSRDSARWACELRAADGRRHLQRARDDLLAHGVHAVDQRLRHLRADLAHADTVVLQIEEDVAPPGELAGADVADGVVDADIHALDAAREDVRPEEGLVAVDADPPDLLLLRRVERADPAQACNVEDDLRAGRDLVERELLALVLRDEVLRVVDEDLHLRVRALRAELVARDPDVDRRDLHAADRADHLLAALLLRHQRREGADETAALVRGVGQALDVLLSAERR